MIHRIPLACSVAAALMVAATPTLAGDDPLASGPSIVGAWEVVMTVRQNAADCATAEPVPFGPNPFPALYTFHEGGTVSETGSRSPPSNRSPGHGIWQREKQRDFVVRVKFQLFDANGLLSNFMDIRPVVSLSKDGSTFRAVGRLLFSDVSGNAMPFCHTLEGTRITL